MSQGFPKGSEWRKWDLHIHTPLSILNNQFPKLIESDEPDWEAYIQALEQLDLAVVGVTDYFTIEGYKKLVEFQKAGRLQNITLLPNIEFRLNLIVGTKRMNLHVIFSNEVSSQDIEEHFLHDLDFIYEAHPESPNNKLKLKLANLEELGHRLKSENPETFSGNGLVVGATTAVVDFESIKKKLSEDKRFENKYLIILAAENLSDIKWGSGDHRVRQNLMQGSHMLFSSNAKDIEWCLGKKHPDPKSFMEEFSSLKPCIHGSDAHELFYIGRPCGKRGNKSHSCQTQPNDCDLRYCWIKADPTFEGLKQLLYEPEDRVKIQTQDPTDTRTSYTLSKLCIAETIINDEIQIQKTELELHKGLVVVTGGKGAGKTAFVDMIANCFVDRVNTSDRNSFVWRIAKDKKPIDLAVTLGFVKAPDFQKKISQQIFVDQSPISYISQGELEDHIGEGTALTKHINRLIFDSPHVKDSVNEYDYLELSGFVERYISACEEFSRSIVDIEGQLAEDRIHTNQITKMQLEADLVDTKRQIDESKTKLSDQTLEQATLRQATIAIHKDRRDQLQELKRLLEKTKLFIQKNLAEFNNDIVLIQKLILELNLAGLEFSLSLADYKADLLDDALSKIEEKIREEVIVIEKEQKNLEVLEEKVRDHTKILDKSRDIEAKIEVVKQQDEELQQLAKLLNTKIQERNNLLSEMLHKILLQKKKYDDIILAFSSSSARILSDLEFSASIQFEEEEFLLGGEDLFKNNIVDVRGGSESDFHHLRRLCHKFSQEDGTVIEELSQEIDKLSRSDLREKIKKSKSINLGDFYRFLYKNYFKVVPVVKYKRTSLSRLSLGQKATVLIKIYLAQGDKPIIIDSHDDHLDNQFIMDELIEAIRQAKKYRQIIIVSNNGNMVINTDAEQIIIAERADTEISFISGSIEDKNIREKVLKVLEGGEEAFKKRQQKYRITSQM